MALDNRLVASIKRNLAEQTSDQLRAMVEQHDTNQFSEEAFEAARELLLDRDEGRAQEPIVNSPEPVHTSLAPPNRLKKVSKLVFVILGAVLGFLLADSGSIFRVSTEHSVVIDPLNILKRTELPSRVKVQLLGNQIYEESGSATQVNDDGRRIFWVATVGFTIVGAVLGFFANALAWKVIRNKRGNIAEQGVTPDRSDIK